MGNKNSVRVPSALQTKKKKPPQRVALFI